MPPSADLLTLLPKAAQDQIAELLPRCRQGRDGLVVVFPQLPRKLGREHLAAGMFVQGDCRLSLGALRVCDAGAAIVLAACQPDPALLWDLYEHGDLEERAMVLRSLALLPISAGTVRLLAEVQRTNMVMHVEAAVCDNNLLRRCAGAPGFGPVEQNRLLLKLAFLDLPLARVFDGEQLANTELSQMLQDLASEREAAGRSVWRDTWRLIGRAPTDGSVARLIGGLEHGDDQVRLCAVEGLMALGRADLLPYGRQRLPRERAPQVLQALQRWLR